jgi:transglutaminase-like putative cysteine protease
MLIRYGYHITIEVSQTTPIVTLLDVHPDRRSDIVEETDLTIEPAGRVHSYLDGFGNLCRRVTAEPGTFSLSSTGLIRDSGEPDPVMPDAEQVPVAELPDDVLVYLLGSRYCETDLMGNIAWSMFGGIQGGWAKVQAICDFVHGHLAFGYENARPTRTAREAFEERVGVCRDFTHLAVTLCRCLNIPARYCNGYLGDIGIEPVPLPMDFNAWFEAYLDGGWYTFDARHNVPRIGRIVIARGRDATDIPMLNSFGPHWLQRFEVVTEEVAEPPYAVAAE